MNISNSASVVAFNNDGSLLASTVEGPPIKINEAFGGRELFTLTRERSFYVDSLAWSPDGRLLASSQVELRPGINLLKPNEDGNFNNIMVHPITLWDAAAGREVRTMSGHNADIRATAFSPDGRSLASGGDDAVVLLSDIASGKRPRAARNVEQKDRRQPVLKLSRADGAAGRTTKVKLEISEPASANQAPPAGARDVRLFRNGTLVKFWRGDALKGQRQATLEAEIPIVAGENRLVAYAFNHDDVKSSDAGLTVIGDESLRRKGVAYVIAFGVNQYANPQYNLKYAAADATSFADEIRAQQAKLQGYERVEVIRLLDCEATEANILLALKRLSNSQATFPPGAPPALSKIQPAQPEDAVSIFFAGHGAAQGARFYLIPHDLGYSGARSALDAEAMRTVLSHGVSDLELEAALESVDAGQMLFVLDACDLGQAIEAEENRRTPMNSSGLAQLAYEKGMYILTAAQSYQAALEAAQLGHGYLTFALIEDGLKKGLADRDPRDGMALAREWFNYAEERVPQMQEREMQTRPPLDSAGNDAKARDPKQRAIQRQRAVYRRELETRQFVVAKP